MVDSVPSTREATSSEKRNKFSWCKTDFKIQRECSRISVGACHDRGLGVLLAISGSPQRRAQCQHQSSASQ